MRRLPTVINVQTRTHWPESRLFFVFIAMMGDLYQTMHSS
jgi:hypothetical protein